MKPLALNTKEDDHLLDHIAPLADLLKCPLLITEEFCYEIAKKFYPQVELHYVPDLEFRLGEIATHYDTLFECKYWQPHLKELFKTLYQKEMRLVFCPHGQSDKGYSSPLLEPYASQDFVLVYGPLMLKMLEEMNIQVPEYQMIGNYRLLFYQKHRTFYDSFLPELDRKKLTVLYAPTWEDLEDSSSFFQWGEKVLSGLHEHCNLLIKPHPLLKQRRPAEYEKISFQMNKRGALLLEEFPPVYPVLSLVDVYLGDASSIGYDFLFFEKPMHFFPPRALRRLHSCGSIVDPHRDLYEQIQKDNLFQKEQKELYEEAFYTGSKKNLDHSDWGGRTKRV